MKPTGIFILDWTDVNPVLKIRGKEELTKKLAMIIGKVGEAIELKAEFTKVSPGKTSEQLGYFYSTVLPCAVTGFREAGYTHISDIDTYKILKDMFLYSTVVNEKTGDLKKVEMSMSDATISDCAKFITECIAFIQEEFGIPVPEPKPKTTNI